MTDPINRIAEEIEAELLQLENRVESLNRESPTGSIQIVQEEVSKKLGLISARITKLGPQQPASDKSEQEYDRHYRAYKAIIDAHLADVTESKKRLDQSSSHLQKHLEYHRQIQDSLQTNRIKLEYSIALLENQPENLLSAKRRIEELENRLSERTAIMNELMKVIAALQKDACTYEAKLTALGQRKGD